SSTCARMVVIIIAPDFVMAPILPGDSLYCTIRTLQKRRSLDRAGPPGLTGYRGIRPAPFCAPRAHSGNAALMGKYGEHNLLLHAPEEPGVSLFRYHTLMGHNGPRARCAPHRRGA